MCIACAAANLVQLHRPRMRSCVQGKKSRAGSIASARTIKKSRRATTDRSLTRKRGPKSGARSFPEWRIFSHNELGDIFLMTRARHCSKLTKASHAQRTPLNMGALHCVTDNHMHVYTARTSGEIEDMGHPLRLRTATRVDATASCSRHRCRPCPFLASKGGRQADKERALRG